MGPLPESLQPDPLGLLGVILKGTFRIDAFAKRGGFGVVYRAWHLSLRKPVAVKVFCLLSSPEAKIAAEALQLFYQEVEILATLEHPATVKPYDFGAVTLPRYGDVPWVALEWLDGMTLAEILRTNAQDRWSPRDALELLRPVMEALAEAHARGVAHRDVAPNNIFVCDTTRGRRVRLIDFGIARIRPPEERAPEAVDGPSLSAMVAHSPRYPAPEQVMHWATGPWTDVHALGLILHQMLTGEMPYPQGNFDPIRGAGSPRRPTPGLVGVDVGAWEMVLGRAVSLDPRARQEHADALLRDLTAALPDSDGRRTDSVEALPAGWRVFDLADVDARATLNTPERTVLVRHLAPSLEALRRGVALPFDAGALRCGLSLERYAGETLSLTAAAPPGGREGLYNTPQGERLTRATVTASKSLYCGHRTVGFSKLTCHASRAGDESARLHVDLPGVALRVRSAAPVRDLVVFEVSDEARALTWLVCVAAR